jgi:hypothetical protein
MGSSPYYDNREDPDRCADNMQRGRFDPLDRRQMISRHIAATSWALHARGLTPTAWKVLMVMAHMVNNKRGDFDVWPKQATLADACDMPISTLKRHINELEEKGFLLRRPRMKKSGGVAGCTYTLNVRATFEMPSSSVTYAFAEDDQDDGEGDEPLAQYERARSTTGERARSTTGERAIELLNPEPLKLEDSPLSLTGEATPTDLLGDPISSSTALVTVDQRGTIIDYVKQGWARLVEDFPRTHAVQAWNDSRQKGIARRAAEIVRDSGGTLDAYAVWDAMFEAIRGDPWLRGEGSPTDRYPVPFSLDIDYILRVKVFARTLEKAKTYGPDTRETHNPVTGRRYGPAEQAGRDALALYLADRKRRG